MRRQIDHRLVRIPRLEAIPAYRRVDYIPVVFEPQKEAARVKFPLTERAGKQVGIRILSELKTYLHRATPSAKFFHTQRFAPHLP